MSSRPVACRAPAIKWNMILLSIVFADVVLAGSAPPQSPATVPPTAIAPGPATSRWGTPDVDGTWLNFDSKVMPTIGTIDLVEGKYPYMKNVRSPMPRSLVLGGTADGDVPYLPWAKAKRDERKLKSASLDRIEFVSTGARCLLYGVPHAMLRSNPQVHQFGDHILMAWEFPRMHRIIWTDGRAPPSQEIKLWQGFSSGKWDGNTLTVTTTNQNGFPWMDQVGDFYSDSVKVTEIFTVVDRTNIDYRVTLEDPTVYTKPWSMAWRFTRLLPGEVGDPVKLHVPPVLAEYLNFGTEILEDACVETDRSTLLRSLQDVRNSTGKTSKRRAVPRDSKLPGAPAG